MNTNTKIKLRLLLAAAIGGGALSPAIFAAELNKTVDADSTYTTQENKVTSGTIVVDGTWQPKEGDRAIANTKEKTGEYGLVSVTVGQNGKIATTNADVFKFSDFSGSQTKEGVTFFKLENAGTISSSGTTSPGRVFQFSVTKGVVEIKNLSTGEIASVDDVLKAAGKIVFDNAGTIESVDGQIIDLGDVNTTSVSNIKNTGTMKSAGNEVISGPANMTIENSGLIETTAMDTSAIKVKVEKSGSNVTTVASANLVLNNLSGGQIIGTKHGVTGDRASTITNAGTISGKGGSGINWDGDVADQNGETFYGNSYYVVKVENKEGGVISGQGDTTALDGDGVDIDYGIDLTNAGTISAKDSPHSADGLAIGGGIVKNLSTGKITAENSNGGAAYGILVDDSNEGNAFAAVTIDNAGTIESKGSSGAAIKLVSDKQNTITNSGVLKSESGTAIILGNGGDKIVINGGEISGDIVGGAGTDTLEIALGNGNTFTMNDDISSTEVVGISSGTFVVNGALSGVELLKFDAGAEGSLGTLKIDTDGSLKFGDNAALAICFAEGTNLDEIVSAGKTFSLLDGLDASALENVTLKVLLGDTDVSATYKLTTSELTAGTFTLASNVPEPSAFGLLAGLGALALVASRRRRIRNA